MRFNASFRFRLSHNPAHFLAKLFSVPLWDFSRYLKKVLFQEIEISHKWSVPYPPTIPPPNTCRCRFALRPRSWATWDGIERATLSRLPITDWPAFSFLYIYIVVVVVVYICYKKREGVLSVDTAKPCLFFCPKSVQDSCEIFHKDFINTTYIWYLVQCTENVSPEHKAQRM